MSPDKANTVRSFPHPLDFKLLDEAGQPVLLVDSPTAKRSLTLALKNFSGQTLTFLKPSSPVPTVENHHLALWFRPGVLSQYTTENLTTTTPGWTMSKANIKRNGSVVFYCLYSEGMEQPANDITSMSLSPMTGKATMLHETRVDLMYQQMVYTGNQTIPLSGSHSTLLRIGKPKLKLQEVQIGDWTIASDPKSGNLLFTTEGEGENDIVQFDKNGGLAIGGWTVSVDDNSGYLLFTTQGKDGGNTIQFDKNGGLAIGDWKISVDESSGNLLFSAEGEDENNIVQFDKSGGFEIGDWSIKTDGSDDLLFTCKGGGTVRFAKGGGVYDGPNALVHNGDEVSISGSCNPPSSNNCCYNGYTCNPGTYSLFGYTDNAQSLQNIPTIEAYFFAETQTNQTITITKAKS